MSSSDVKTWTTADFDAMSWHDNAVHALRVIEGEHGEGELVLDVDYIEEWIRNGDCIEFVITPATLQFHNVTELRVALDYAGPTAGICPFSLDGIERREHVFPNGHTTYRWQLPVGWPAGEISFFSSGYTQTQIAPCVRSGRQHLDPTQRVPVGSG